MKTRLTIAVVTTLFLSVGLTGQTTLELYSTDAFVLLKVRESLQNQKSPFQPAYKRLLREAEEALDLEATSVVTKEKFPPSGNKHDYMSMGRYWWPDPTKPDGLPYIRRDGESNPEIAQFKDHENLGVMASASSTLGLAYFFSGKVEFAKHAARFIRTWFLDSATAMSPHLQYAQAVPGRSDGRGTGILDGRHFVLVIDAVGMIRGSGEWSNEEDAALRTWFGQYTDWLVTSKNGLEEAAAKNNHGTWYDAHVIPAALYAGKRDVALKFAREVPAKRIFAQISADGMQPEELARTRSWHYSIFNLEAFVRLSVQTKKLGVDLWSARGPEGESLRMAVDVLLPFAKGEKEWTYKEIEGVDKVGMSPLLLAVFSLTHDPVYRAMAFEFGGSRLEQHRSVLLTGAEPRVKP